MSSSPPNPRAAYCEDYSEDAHTTLSETRQTANMAAKRSRPDITKLKFADTHDERSDSGNSSQTVATLNSGDSSLESKAGAKPLKVDTRAPAIRRRPALPPKKSEHRLPSPQKSSQKRNSSKARDEQPKKTERKTEIRKSLTPLDTSWTAAANRQGRHRHEAPNTPQSARPPPPRPTQDVPLPQPAIPRPRAATAQGFKVPRPMSYHGAVPGVVYMQLQPQPQPISLERRAQTPYTIPPLVRPPPSFPPNRGSYFPASPAPAPRRQDSFPFPSSPYDIQPRPQPRSWTTEHPSHRHSMVYTSPPVIDYSPQPQYIPRPPSAQPVYRYSHSYYDPSPPPLENTFSHDEDFYRMPPPPAPAPIAKPQQRPTMRHAVTTSTARPLLHHHHGRRIEDRGSGQRSPRKEQVGEHTGSRRPSLTSRPSATPSSENPHTHLVEHDIARLSIDSNEVAAKHRRRASYYGHETRHDLERVAETYQHDVKTTADALPVPITSDSLKLVREKTHSDTGSRASADGGGSGDGSDVKPRSSTDRRTGSDVKSRDDAVTVRFNPASGVNLDVKGGSTEGRTISFRQSRDAQGEMELSIGAKERHSLSRTASRNEARERHAKKYPSVRGAAGVKQVEVARSVSRARGEREPGRDRTRSVAGSRSRRSSKSGYSGRGEGFF